MLGNDNVAPKPETGQERRLHLLDGVPLTPEAQEQIDAASERDNAAMRLAMEKWNTAKWRTLLLTELRENTAACNRNADAVTELKALLEGREWGDDA
jgi:hypothetical protein